MSIFASNILDTFRIRVFTSSVNKFFIKTFEDVVNFRVREKVVRKDFINLLMELTDCNSKADKISDKGKRTFSFATISDLPFLQSIRCFSFLIPGVVMEKLNMLEAAAQVFVFFIAGFETTSTTVTYCLHELAKHPEVQRKLQDEIDEIADTPGGFNYENVMNMSYLDMVFCGELLF